MTTTKNDTKPVDTKSVPVDQNKIHPALQFINLHRKVASNPLGAILCKLVNVIKTDPFFSMDAFVQNVQDISDLYELCLRSDYTFPGTKEAFTERTGLGMDWNEGVYTLGLKGKSLADAVMQYMGTISTGAKFRKVFNDGMTTPKNATANHRP